MPIRAVQRYSQRLSEHYYRYGQLVASRTNLLLFLSLSFISYFSFPVIKKQFSLPTVQIASLDGQCWQISPHVQIDNSTTISSYTIQQIRLSHIDRPITFELVQQAHKIYTSIAGNEALSHICYQNDDQCIIQAPPLFRNEQDWKEQSSHVDVQKYDIHPFSIYGNVTFDQHGNYAKADSIFLSFVLKHEPEYYSIWSEIVDRVQQEFGMVDIHHKPLQNAHWYHTTLDTPSYMFQYKHKIFPYDVPSRVQLLIVAYIVMFYLVSIAFGKSNLIKSGYTFGLAAVFLSVACFTTAWGITGRLGITLSNVSWPLLLLAVNIACLENIFLLTNAVLDAGCDMVVKEKISRGLKSVGLPMTTTLLAELMILSVGTAMNITMIKEFCLFVKVALVVDYMLEMSFVIAVLSMDIKRVELADLDDRKMSKRAHELATYDTENKQLSLDFCPKQDTANKEDSRSCADCKDFKTHRVYNSLMLCFIVLGLSLFTKKEKQFHTIKRLSQSLTTNITSHHIPDYQSSVYELSDQFWSIINPEREAIWVEVDSPHLFIYDVGTNAKVYTDKVQDYYFQKALTVNERAEDTHSLFRLFINAVLQRIVVFLFGINIPVLILWLCLIGIITWMTPKWRDQWLLPLLVRTFNKSVLAILDFLRSVRDTYNGYIQSIRDRREYDADGLHRGAIGTQAIFNREQAHVNSIRVQTLSHQHLADIQNLDSNAKGSLVSCGQDNRLVLWDAEKGTWMARLDRTQEQDGIRRASWNPAYKKSRKRNYATIHSKSQRSRPVCVKVDQGNTWIAAGFDDHTIRIWNCVDGKLETEMDLGHHVQVQTEESQTLRNRTKTAESKPKQGGDHILDIKFIGAIPEYCDPSIAEVAARCKAETNKSQNCLLTIHKSGLIREWGIPSGECYQTIKTGHTREITRVHVVAAKAPHRKPGVTWIFTASKDGAIKCWERQIQKASQWTLIYTVEQHSPITAIATESPVGGMGILVSGSSDGTVKVWNFETGQPIHSLSTGKPKQTVQDYSTGGPIRHFSNFNDRLSDTESVNSSDAGYEKPDHQGSIHQVVVTRYCEVENGPGLCRGCDTCFGNGFLIASSSADNYVHAWRLERSEGSNEGSCRLCTRDYHRKQYKHHKTDESGEPTTRRRLKSPSQTHKVSIRYKRQIKKVKDDHLPGLVDIEQLGGAVDIKLSSTFLGKIEQHGCNGLVFCDKILAGVRRRKSRKMEWEAWFAPLQYYEPTEEDRVKIAVETFSLDQADDSTTIKENTQASFLSLFRSATQTAGPVVYSSFKYKNICAADKDDTLDYDEKEAGENLPFSTVRHVIPLDGRGLACDYGNFIKLVYIDNKISLTEKESHKQKRMQEEDEQDESGQDDNICSPATQGKDGCCGGVNKKNGEKKKKAQKIICDNKSMSDCSVKQNCSYASECTSFSKTKWN